jgi:putative DNA primase/helicase
MQPKIILGAGGTPFAVLDDSVPHLNGSAGKNGKSDRLGPSVTILPATAFTPEPVRWLWEGWLARGKLHLLAGAPGTGKTTIAVSIAATVSVGARWPDGTAGEAGDVLIWSGEDSVSDTLLPRLLVAGGDPRRVHFVDGVRENGKGRPFDPATDMPALVAAARLLPNLKLIILDPVVAAVSGDSHKNTETRRGLQPVVDLAGQLDCCLLGITHLSKNTSGREPLERVAGSIAFGAVARVVLATVKPADTEEPRRLVRAKSNIGPDSGGFAYTLFGALVPGHDFSAQRVDWGAALEGSARELMAVEQMDTAGEALDEGEAFLTDFLRDGPVATREIKIAANANGHTWRTLERAKKSMGVVAVKGGFNAGWSWQLPAPNTANQGSEDRLQD